MVNKFVHVLVAEAMLGRELHPWETVHHKDGNVKNPHHSNLLVIDVRLHGAVSAKQQWYLKKKFSREDAAWMAFFDITGKTYDDFDDTTFDPATLGSVTSDCSANV